MKTLKFLFAGLTLSMVTACSGYYTPEQETNNSGERDLLQSKLIGEWIVADQKDNYIYTFADDDTVYIKTREGDTIDKWPYLPVAGDLIRIIRNRTTHNKVVFYSDDSIRINDFIPSVGAVYPPEFGDVVLNRWVNDSEGSESDDKGAVIGSDCSPQPFSETYAKYKNASDTYFIKGEVVDVVQHGNKIKIIQDFKNNFEDNTIITVWGSGKICNRMDPLYDNHRTDTLLLLIRKTDLSESLLCPQCEHYEQPDDYMTMGCYYSVLKLSNGTVSGKITDAYRDDIMLWADFVTQFEITK
jgi:hypothetical protein